MPFLFDYEGKTLLRSILLFLCKIKTFPLRESFFDDSLWSYDSLRVLDFFCLADDFVEFLNPLIFCKHSIPIWSIFNQLGHVVYLVCGNRSTTLWEIRLCKSQLAFIEVLKKHWLEEELFRVLIIVFAIPFLNIFKLGVGSQPCRGKHLLEFIPRSGMIWIISNRCSPLQSDSLQHRRGLVKL